MHYSNPDTSAPVHQFAKTLLCQGYLVPLPLHVAPVYWALGHAMALYPAPDLVVCADKYDPYTSLQDDTAFINPVSRSPTAPAAG